MTGPKHIFRLIFKSFRPASMIRQIRIQSYTQQIITVTNLQKVSEIILEVGIVKTDCDDNKINVRKGQKYGGGFNLRDICKSLDKIYITIQ